MLSAVFWLVLTAGMAQPYGPSTGSPPAPAHVMVSGRLITEHGTPLISGTVILSPSGPGVPRAPAARDVTVLPDGRFTFRDVAPGEYLIRARARTASQGPSLFATFVLDVRSRDVQQIDLMLKPGAVVQGEVVIDARHGSTPPVLSQLRVRAPHPNGSTFGDTRGAVVRRDGSFSVDGVMEGTHVLVVHGLTFPWRIAEARIQGQDAVERVFDVDARQQIRGARIVLADIGAGVSGRVTTAAGAAAVGALVVAFPADPLRRALPLRFVGVGRAAADGAYRIVDLAAGEYRVAAAPGATEQDAMDPLVLERWIPISTPITLTENTVAVVTLTTTPGPATAPVP